MLRSDLVLMDEDLLCRRNVAWRTLPWPMQIAHRLGISEVTVKFHRGNTMREMGARSPAELVKMTEALNLQA